MNTRQHNMHHIMASKKYGELNFTRSAQDFQNGFWISVLT